MTTGTWRLTLAAVQVPALGVRGTPLKRRKTWEVRHLCDNCQDAMPAQAYALVQGRALCDACCTALADDEAWR